MKKAIMMAALIFLFVGCTMAQQGEYTVTGTCQQSDTKIYIIDMKTDGVISETKATNGTFTIKGTAEKDALLGVREDNSIWTQLFFNDGTPVTIDIAKKTLKGSALNEKLTNYDLQSYKLQEEYQQLYQEFAALSPAEKETKAPEIQVKVMQVISNLQTLLKTIFSENKDNYIPAAFLQDALQVFEEDEIKNILNPDATYYHHPFASKTIKAYNSMMEQEAAKDAIIGKPFTDLEEADVNGKMHKLSEYVGKGTWVLIDFWASWCGPCRQEMPNVVANYNKYHDKGFDIVGLSFDEDKDDWVQAIKDLEMPWTHLSDLKGWETVAGSTYNVRAIPASILVDPNGIIVARDLRGEALGKKLKEIFGE